MAVKPIPDGYHTLTPYVVVDGAAEFIKFLKAAFNAQESFQMPTPEGKIGHAEVKIGDSLYMLGDICPEFPVTNSHLCVYVTDCDSAYKQAIKAGAVSLSEPEDQFYGDRAARIKDKWGNSWMIHTHVKDVSPEEMKKAMEAKHKA